jgi:hypothetical protein
LCYSGSLSEATRVCWADQGPPKQNGGNTVNDNIKSDIDNL